MSVGIKYVHTNLVAKDWRKLAQFYTDVFACRPVYPERDLSGEWLEKVTSIEQARIKGIHLVLPGYGSGGPALEIFEYEPESLRTQTNKINPSRVWSYRIPRGLGGGRVEPLDRAWWEAAGGNGHEGV